jgi:hypothetical protein
MFGEPGSRFVRYMRSCPLISWSGKILSEGTFVVDETTESIEIQVLNPAGGLWAAPAVEKLEFQFRFSDSDVATRDWMQNAETIPMLPDEARMRAGLDASLSALRVQWTPPAGLPDGVFEIRVLVRCPPIAGAPEEYQEASTGIIRGVINRGGTWSPAETKLDGLVSTGGENKENIDKANANLVTMFDVVSKIYVNTGGDPLADAAALSAADASKQSAIEADAVAEEAKVEYEVAMTAENEVRVSLYDAIQALAAAQLACVDCAKVPEPIKTESTVSVTTADVAYADSPEKIYIQFYICTQFCAWTGKELFFEGTERKEVHSKAFASALDATKLRLSMSDASSGNAWGFALVTFDGVIIKQHPNGLTGPRYSNSNDGYGYFIDTDGQAPRSIDINIAGARDRRVDATPTTAAEVAVLQAEVEVLMATFSNATDARTAKQGLMETAVNTAEMLAENATAAAAAASADSLMASTSDEGGSTTDPTRTSGVDIVILLFVMAMFASHIQWRVFHTDKKNQVAPLSQVSDVSDYSPDGAEKVRVAFGEQDLAPIQRPSVSAQIIITPTPPPPPPTHKPRQGVSTLLRQHDVGHQMAHVQIEHDRRESVSKIC